MFGYFFNISNFLVIELNLDMEQITSQNKLALQAFSNK